jgi:transposase
MTPVPAGTMVWLAAGHAYMPKGFDGLALLVQEKLEADPHGGQLFVFRDGTATCSISSGTMTRGFACLRSGWSGAGSSRQQPRARP